MTEPSTSERRIPADFIGNGREVETRARNTARGSIVDVLDAIRQRQRFLLTSHARPDGDAVGSLLALWMTLSAMGKQAEMELFDPVPMIYRNTACSGSDPAVCRPDGWISAGRGDSAGMRQRRAAHVLRAGRKIPYQYRPPYQWPAIRQCELDRYRSQCRS